MLFRSKPNTESPPPSSSVSPIVVETPTQTPEETPSEEPSDSTPPSPEIQYITHKIGVTTNHLSLNQIAAYYNETYSLNYPNTAMLVGSIAAINNIPDVNIISYGQEIKIPITPIP